MRGFTTAVGGVAAALMGLSLIAACTEDSQSGPAQISVDGGVNDAGTATDAATTDALPVDTASGFVDAGSADVAVPAGAQLLALAGAAEHVALGSAQVYWTDPGSQRVLRVGLNGGGVEMVAKEVGINMPADVAVADGVVYWAARNPTLYFLRRYQEANAAKATVLTAKPEIAPQVIRDVTADATHVYFTTGSNPEPNYTGLIRRVEIGEGTAVTLRSWQKEPTGIALKGDHVYWSTRHGPAVQRVLKNGSELEPVAKEITGALALVVDGTFAWWCNAPGLSVDVKEGTIMRAAVQGGPPLTIATKQQAPVAMASGANHIWWVNAGTAAGGWKDGQLVRFERSGKSDPEVVRDGLKRPMDLALGASAVFWLMQDPNNNDPGAIFRLDTGKL